MAVDTHPTTFLDLYTALQNATREQTGVTALQNQAKRAINTALFDMHIGTSEQFPWAERRAVLRTQPQYQTGTISITQGSTALTGSGTSWNTNNAFGIANARAGGKVTIAGSVDVYEVASVGSDTAIVLKERFIGADVSGANYTYFEDEYDLSADFLRPVDLQNFDTNGEIRLISRKKFRSNHPRNRTPGRVRIAALSDHDFNGNTTRVRRVRFWKPPSSVVLIPYSFITNKLAVDASGNELTQLVSDTDEPIVPLPYRYAIVLHALYHWYRDKKDDGRSGEVKSEYTDLMLRIVGDHETGSAKPQLQPNLAGYKRSARRPYRRGTRGRYTTGTAFDEFRD